MHRSAFSPSRFFLRFAPRFASRRAARAAPNLSRRARAAVGALVAGAVLMACSPTFDWRTIMNDDNGYTVDLPAKPGTDERTIDIGGTQMKMRMQTAEAGHAVFAVGTVMLPGDNPRMQQAALDFLRTGLARNLGATPEYHATQIPLAAGGQVPGIEMAFSGKAGPQQETRTLHARLVVRGQRVYQAAVIADRELPAEQLDQFFQSFKLY